MICAEQIRAARGLLDIDKKSLADATGLTPGTIGNVERDGPTHSTTLKRIEEYFVQRGIVFLPPGAITNGGCGVRLAGVP